MLGHYTTAPNWVAGRMIPDITAHVKASDAPIFGLALLFSQVGLYERSAIAPLICSGLY